MSIITIKKKYKETNLSAFVAMRGNYYDKKINEDNAVRLMIVGRAVNGWGSIDTATAETFASDAVRLFNDNCRFSTEWRMKDGETNPYSEYIDPNTNELKYYYLSKSPFWSTSLEIYKELSKHEAHRATAAYENIVWNNIYKIAPSESGNPSTNLIYAQAPTCVKILKEEIALLKPTHILMIIDKSWISWKSHKKIMFDFMDAFDRNRICYPINEQNSKYVQKAFATEDSKVIVTCRPERVAKDDFVKAICHTFSHMQ